MYSESATPHAEKGPGSRRTAAACADPKLRGPRTLAHGRLPCIASRLHWRESKLRSTSANLVDRESSRHGAHICGPSICVLQVPEIPDPPDFGQTPRREHLRKQKQVRSFKIMLSSCSARAPATKRQLQSSTHDRFTDRTAAWRIRTKLGARLPPNCPARRLGQPCHVHEARPLV